LRSGQGHDGREVKASPGLGVHLQAPATFLQAFSHAGQALALVYLVSPTTVIAGAHLQYAAAGGDLDPGVAAQFLQKAT